MCLVLVFRQKPSELLQRRVYLECLAAVPFRQESPPAPDQFSDTLPDPASDGAFLYFCHCNVAFLPLLRRLSLPSGPEIERHQPASRG